jgi:arylsulfatase A-like enzyme
LRRSGLLLALWLASCTSPRGAPSASPVAAASRSNVLLITIDTLRADHLGLYGYRRPTSPSIDALGASSRVFDRAYTYWPKTRGSMVILLTGRMPSENGYSRTHPVLFPFNKTIAAILGAAGYETAAAVDNSNVSAQNGYASGFKTYRETWEEGDLKTEAERGRAITDSALRLFRTPPPSRPFFLWLHYVNPHAPYTPPEPFNTKFQDALSQTGPHLPTVRDFHGGIHKEWADATPGHQNAPYFVAQYDGEVATADAEVGRVLEGLKASGAWERTLILLTSDHGESLGEHDYYFDHGEDVYEPCLRIPLIVRVPGRSPGREEGAASTLDVLPTILDGVKVSYPPGLPGRSLLEPLSGERRLFAQNDRDLAATTDVRFTLIATPESGRTRYALYDRKLDPGETKDVSREHPEEFRERRRLLESFLEERDAEWVETRRLAEGQKEARETPQSCEEMKRLGYLPSSTRCRS